MMSTGGETLCQGPYMPPAGIQSTRIPHLRPGFGMGMISMSYSTGFPMIPVPPMSLHPSSSPAAGFYWISGPAALPVPRLQVPLIASQALPSHSVTSTVPTPFTRELYPPFNHSNQGVSSSQITDGPQLPFLSQVRFQPSQSLDFANVILSVKILYFHEAGRSCSSQCRSYFWLLWSLTTLFSLLI